jgi:hypothetical protein
MLGARTYFMGTTVPGTMECRRIIVHAGLHRTGTTSLQHQLPRMVQGSRVQVRVIPVHDRIALRQQPALTTIARRIKVSDRPDAPDIVLSNEGLLGHFSDGYLDGPARAAELRALLPDSPSTTPVVLFRPLVDWLESAYRTSVQEGSYEPPEAFVERVLASPWSSWARMSEDLAAEFSGMSPVMLPLFPGVDSTLLLIDALDLPRASPARRRPHLNASLSAVHTTWLRAFNEVSHFDPHHRDIVIDVMKRHLPVSSQPDTVFSPTFRRHIADRSRREWGELVDLLVRPTDVPEPSATWAADEHGEKEPDYSGAVAAGDPSMSALVALVRSTLIEMNHRHSTLPQKMHHATRRILRRSD